jgi:hypothetical protein
MIWTATLVTVTFSKALFDPAASTTVNKLDQIFTFTNGTTPSLFRRQRTAATPVSST